MSNCNHLQSYGLSVELVEGKLRIYPSDKVTEEIKEYVRQNRDDIVSELKDHKTYTLDDLLIDSTDPNASTAIKYHVPDLGEFWIVCDEDMRKELISEGLPCILAEDLLYNTHGKTHTDRLKRLHDRVAAGSPIVQAILGEFPGSQISKVEVEQ